MLPIPKACRGPLAERRRARSFDLNPARLLDATRELRETVRTLRALRRQEEAGILALARR